MAIALRRSAACWLGSLCIPVELALMNGRSREDILRFERRFRCVRAGGDLSAALIGIKRCRGNNRQRGLGKFKARESAYPFPSLSSSSSFSSGFLFSNIYYILYIWRFRPPLFSSLLVSVERCHLKYFCWFAWYTGVETVGQLLLFALASATGSSLSFLLGFSTVCTIRTIREGRRRVKKEDK